LCPNTSTCNYSNQPKTSPNPNRNRQGYASVTPLALTPHHAALLTATTAYAPGLVSLSLSGKVEVSGDALAVLLGDLSGLRALSLDVHFTKLGVGVMGRLRELTKLEVRGGEGRLVVYSG
jgi:hypothetical protein